MKKVLFATTALIATTGMAAAEISFGGFGRFGLFYDDGADEDVRVEQRFRLTATGTTTSDNGLEFEGRIRFQTDDNVNGASGLANRSAAGFAVSTGGFRLDVGQVSDVIDSGDVVNYYGYGVGLTSFAEQSSGFGLPASGFGTSSDDTEVAPTVKLRYQMGDFTVSASITDDSEISATSAAISDGELLASDGTIVAAGGTLENTTTTSRDEYQIGVGYSFGNYSVGVAYGNEDGDVVASSVVDGVLTSTVNTNEDFDFWAVSFDGELGAFAFSILIADYEKNDDTSYGFSVKYDVGAATDIRFAFADNGVDGDDEVYAIGFQHGLGGGVSLRGGVGQATDGDTIADLGVVFNF
ncbi:porin [uncultured Tateyamaria sp.]|uniref:porin n=1 Tax=uncultured Tateyamaria sp. TaxID=455651 RepID=UPI0026153384|nr:porin [uncultured Tateyamaria sp.]